jgi:hypothetical protein
MRKAKNDATGAVHWMTNKKWYDLEFICLCGMVSRILWTNADGEKVTCRKCLSIKREE